jgi:hypothetical protein
MNENLLPPILMYKEFIIIASIRFNVDISIIRSKYGLFTLSQWNELLNYLK